MIFISFLLDMILSSYLKYTSVFKPLFVISNLLFLDYKKQNTICVLICGILYDIAYTSTFPLNTLLFFGIYFILNKFNLKDKNIFLYLVLNTIIIIIYRFISLTIFSFFNVTSFNYIILFKEIYSSIILNLIYTCILYFIYKKSFKSRTSFKNMI